MKVWAIRELGEPHDVLELQQQEMPQCGEGQVLIQMKAAALNFFDILQCQGKYQEQHETPFTPGAEIAGVIVDANDSNFSLGQRVLATPILPNGGLSEFVCIDAEQVYAIPDELSFQEAAALFITYQTAYYALHRCGKLQDGETLLVHAGAGGVGSAAIQLGKAAGSFVIATAGSDEKLAICKELGADVVINYRTDNFIDVVKNVTNQKGANVIFDSVGGDIFDQSTKCIAFEGRILAIGFAGGRIPQLAVNHALIKNYSVVGVHFGLFKKHYPAEVRKAHEQLMAFYQQGKIKPLLYNAYHFEEVPNALHELSDRKTFGKLVVTP